MGLFLGHNTKLLSEALFGLSAVFLFWWLKGIMVFQGETTAVLDSIKRTYHKFLTDNVDDYFHLPDSTIDKVMSILKYCIKI